MKIVVINLDRDVERLEWMGGQLGALGLSYERFPALTPETIPDDLRARFHRQADAVLSAGEIGCFASHLRIAQKLLEAGDQCWLVVEDDVEISCSADELRALGAAAAAYPLVKLNDWPKTPTLELRRVGRFQIVRYWTVPRGTGSYFLTPAGARVLLNSAWGLTTVADDHFRRNATVADSVVGVTPPPAIQDRFGKSTIDPARARAGTRTRTRSRPKGPSDAKGAIVRATSRLARFGAVDSARMITAQVLMRAQRVKRDTDRRFVLNPRGKRASGGPPRVIFVAHNRNHVSIFERPAAILRARGAEVEFSTIEGHADQPHAHKAIEMLGYQCTEIEAVVRRARPQDIVCLGNDWSPKRLRRALDLLQRRGTRLVGVVEGARFSFPKQYARVDEILCWGPSGRELLARPTTVVGSPMIEKAYRLERKPRERPHTLINYKFAYGAEDENFAWGRAAINAAEAVDPDYVLSTHPASRGVPSDVHVSHAPFHEHLAEASLLITRSSTVIYEALAAGVAVLYFPLPDEKPAEFGDPRGAFETAESAEQLLKLARSFALAPTCDSARASSFLDRHVSIDLTRSADERIADALAERLGMATEINAATR